MSTATRPRSLILKPHEQAALRDGRLGMLIRPVKPQPPAWVASMGFTGLTPPGYVSGRGDYCDMGRAVVFESPFGPVGTELWIQEDYHHYHWDYDRYVYRSTPHRVRKQIETYEVGEWTPAETMLRAASRDTLRLTSLTVKRIQDATEEEAIAWGVDGDSCLHMLHSASAKNRIRLRDRDAWEQNAWCVFGGVEKKAGDS